jgi:formylglycine-generating enzyme
VDVNGVVVGTALVAIQGGAFLMGDDSGRRDERPRHRVRLRGFLASRWPVSNGEYALYLAATGHPPPRFWEQEPFRRPAQPVVGVSWYDAAAYCSWLSERLGRRCRLPAEAEWEYAARGGIEAEPYAWGSAPPLHAGVSLADVRQDAPWPVGTSPANDFGLHDMGFNVHEWCQDWYDAGYYARSDVGDPGGPASGLRRASRWGAWRHRQKVSRCAARSSLCPAFQYNDYGFRVFADP